MFKSKSVYSVLALAALGSTGALLSTSAEALVLPARWTGGVSCTITTNGPYNYHDQQTHAWTIFWNAAQSQNGATAIFADQWSETGAGSKDGVRWTINGHATGGVGFRHDAQGNLIIGLASSALRDPVGITVTDASHMYSAPAYEWQFPIIRVQGSPADVVSAPVQVPINGSVGFQETGGSMSTAVCSWKFHYGPVTLNLPHRPL